MYMLDTNICIYAIKHSSSKLIERLKECDTNDVCISSITYSELVYGVEKSEAKEKNWLALTLMLTNIKVLDYDTSASEEYGLIRADLERKGCVIGPLDLLIASHAKSQDCTLITNNMKKFKRVKGLKLENWTR